MRSRAEMRAGLEHVLRGIVIAALAVMLWQSVRDQTGSSSRTVNARGAGRGALATWSSAATPPARIHLQLDSIPGSFERAWLGALAGAGSAVTWNGEILPLMIDARPIPSPTGGTTAFIAAPAGSSVMVSDEVGAIDTIQTQNRGASLSLNSVSGPIAARVKGSVASTIQQDSLALHRILVIGEAGWESKFVVAALEEEGWKVDAFIRVAPGVEVSQGSAAAIDTSRYSAVIALDGAASPYANRIIEFVRSGGGALLAPPAASLNAMSLLRAGSIGRASPERATRPDASVDLAALTLAPITSLASDAIPLEKRAGAVAIAARRIGAGRAIQLGYEDTWRWRMSGSDGAVQDHRAWWTGLVSRVAYAPRVQSVSTTGSTDEAPMIGLVDAIGRSSAGRVSTSRAGTPSSRLALLFLVLAIALLGEITSRRLRGVA